MNEILFFQGGKKFGKEARLGNQAFLFLPPKCFDLIFEAQGPGTVVAAPDRLEGLRGMASGVFGGTFDSENMLVHTGIEIVGNARIESIVFGTENIYVIHLAILLFPSSLIIA